MLIKSDFLLHICIYEALECHVSKKKKKVNIVDNSVVIDLRGYSGVEV